MNFSSTSKKRERWTLWERRASTSWERWRRLSWNTTSSQRHWLDSNGTLYKDVTSTSKKRDRSHAGRHGRPGLFLDVSTTFCAAWVLTRERQSSVFSFAASISASSRSMLVPQCLVRRLNLVRIYSWSFAEQKYDKWRQKSHPICHMWWYIVLLLPLVNVNCKRKKRTITKKRCILRACNYRTRNNERPQRHRRACNNGEHIET